MRLLKIALVVVAGVSTPAAAAAPAGYVNLAARTPYANVAGWTIDYQEVRSSRSCDMRTTDLGNLDGLSLLLGWDADVDRVTLIFAIKNGGWAKTYSSSMIVHLLDLDDSKEPLRRSANWVMASSTVPNNIDLSHIIGTSTGGQRFLDAAEKSEALALFRSKEEYIGTFLLKDIGAAVSGLRQCAQSRVPKRDAK